jgi:hypothetical protein
MRRRSRGAATPLVTIVVGCALLAGPAPLAAQVEFGPSIGAFWPLGGWTHDFSGYQVKRRHLFALMFGGRVAYWPTTRLGIEGAVGFSPSQVAVSEPDNTEDITGGVVLGSLRGLLRLVTLVDGNEGSGFSYWDVNLGLGAGVVARGGSAWANVSGATHPAAVLSLESRTHLARTVTIRVGVEDFLSWATFDEGLPSETGSRLHNDLVVTLAFQFRLGGGSGR